MKRESEGKEPGRGMGRSDLGQVEMTTHGQRDGAQGRPAHQEEQHRLLAATAAGPEHGAEELDPSDQDRVDGQDGQQQGAGTGQPEPGRESGDE